MQFQLQTNELRFDWFPKLLSSNQVVFDANWLPINHFGLLVSCERCGSVA